MTEDSGRATRVVLVVGHGLIGSAIREQLQAQPDLRSVCVGRRPRNLPDHLDLDLASEAGRAALEAAVVDLRPQCVVLVHGPSDVTWINENEAEAAAVHCGVAAIVAGSGARAVLVSSDNVFSGRHGRYLPHDPTEPANGYGRVKLNAEDILLSGGAALVVRVSLVYGWAGAGQRVTYAQRCLAAAADGRTMSAPTDQTFTPIHVRDVAAVIAAACDSAQERTDIQHLAGPVELSRFAFARLTYRLAGADPALVRPCLRRETEWAGRPRFSSLASGTFMGLLEQATWRPMTPTEGLREMLATQPTARGGALVGGARPQ